MASFVGWALRRDPHSDDPSNHSSIESSPSSSTIVYTPSAPSLPSSSISSSSCSAPPSYYSSITPSAPSETDIEKMRAENCRLRAVLEMIKKNKKDEGGKGEGENIDGYSFEHLGSVPGANGFLLSIPSAPPSVSSASTLSNDALWTPLPPSSKPIPTNPFVLPSSTSSSISPPSASSSTISSSSSTIDKESEVLLTPDDASTVIVKSEAEGEVALLDLSEIDWYVMVNHDGSTSDNASSSSASNDRSAGKVRAKIDRRGKYSGPVDDKIVDSEMLGENDDGYLLIDHEDYIVALSDFISRSIQKRFPEAEQIPPEQLRKILGTAFKPLQPPSKFGKAIGWANFLYHSYSWGTTAFTIYREGVYAKLVLRGAMKAAQWLLVLVL